jgi:hypothetical protein
MTPMSTSRTARIHRGFNRLGIVFALLFTALAVGAAFKVTPEDRLYATAIFLAVAAAAYVFIRAIGWIIAGFVGE